MNMIFRFTLRAYWDLQCDFPKVSLHLQPFFLNVAAVNSVHADNFTDVGHKLSATAALKLVFSPWAVKIFVACDTLLIPFWTKATLYLWFYRGLLKYYSIYGKCQFYCSTADPVHQSRFAVPVLQHNIKFSYFSPILGLETAQPLSKW